MAADALASTSVARASLISLEVKISDIDATVMKGENN